MHRRRSSKDTIDGQENHQVLSESNDSFRSSDSVSFPQKNKSTAIHFLEEGSENVPPSLESGGTSPSRVRVNSVPSQPPGNEQPQQNQQPAPSVHTHHAPPSAGPYRTSFGSQLQGGSLPIPIASPLRKSFTQGYTHGQGHARAMSSSGTFGFASPMPSPLYNSFPSRPVSTSGLNGSPPKTNGN